MKKVEKMEKRGLTIGLGSGIVCKLLRESGVENEKPATKVAKEAKKVLDKANEMWYLK